MSLIIDVFGARSDNFGYLAHDSRTGKTAAIDAPDAEAIKAALQARGWSLDKLLITHHHIDHVEGIPALKAAFPKLEVVGPRAEADKIEGLDTLISAGDTVTIGSVVLDVLATPGHTLGHIVFHDAVGQHLFSADALFSMGVGRMFEGTPVPMWEGLVPLRALPDATLVYCGHEYTASNGKFALHVEPDNKALQARMAEVEALRAAGKATIPVSMGVEKATNPFLRADLPHMAKAMGLPAGTPAGEVFGALRKAKDSF